MPGSPDRTSFTPGRVNVSPSDTQGGSRVPELGPLGSVRGALSNERPYRDLPKLRTEGGESRKRYLYVAIDRASRFVHLAVKDDETTALTTHQISWRAGAAV